MTGCGRSGSTIARGRERGGCLLRLMVLLVIVGAMLSLAWMALLPVAFVHLLKERTGFDAEVASLSANPFIGRVTLRGLVVTNPSTFTDPDFLQLRSFEAEVSMRTLFNKKLEIDTLTLDVRQLTLVKRTNGPTNLDAFRVGLAPREPTATAHLPARAGPAVHEHLRPWPAVCAGGFARIGRTRRRKRIGGLFAEGSGWLARRRRKDGR